MAGAGGTVDTRYNPALLRFGFCSHRRRFYFRRLLADRVTFERPVTCFFFNADDRPDDARFALLGDAAKFLPTSAFIPFLRSAR